MGIDLELLLFSYFVTFVVNACFYHQCIQKMIMKTKMKNEAKVGIAFL